MMISPFRRRLISWPDRTMRLWLSWCGRCGGDSLRGRCYFPERRGLFLLHADLGAQGIQGATRALRAAGGANATAMMNDAVAQGNPLLLGKQRHQVLLHLCRVLFRRESQASSDSQ